MADSTSFEVIPIPEQTLRKLSKDIVGIFPKFTDQETVSGVKNLHAVIDPLLDTAASPELGSGHRAAVCNVLCAILERCQALELPYVQDAILDDSIWSRAFKIYLEKSDGAKGKSVRQVLVTLTSILLRNQTTRAYELQEWAIANLVDIICLRQDRSKVKPALQGLAHFIQKDIATIPRLMAVHANIVGSTSGLSVAGPDIQPLFSVLLAWIVHHDTSLSAGHVVKNFLAQLRRTSHQGPTTVHDSVATVWMKPVVDCLHQWPDRIQEFKTHVFPHCFLPNVEEYVHFLSYLHFPRHVDSRGPIPEELSAYSMERNVLEDFEEFRILLASIQTGKELGVLKDTDYRIQKTIEIEQDALILPDDIFGGWLSHMESEVRLAGLFLCVYSTNVTRTITGGIFKSLQKNLLHLHTDPDVNFRRELISYIQRLFNRLRGSTATLAKFRNETLRKGEGRHPFPEGSPVHQNSSTAKDPLVESLRFITWYLSFIEGEIRLDAAYQRRITGLRALMVVLKSGVDPRVPHHYLSKGAQSQLHWAHGLQLANVGLIRKLLDMMLDPFDDVRDTSVSILQILFETMSEEGKLNMLSMLPPFIKRAEATMLRTGRADHADGLARAYALYHSCVPTSLESREPSSVTVLIKIDIIRRLNKQLQETLEIARDDLAEAVNGRPVHGIFAAIRYIVDQDEFYSELDKLDADGFNELKKIHNQLLDDCTTMWIIVENILSADAPEGHVPEDMDEEVSLDTKEILSYSWRGLKEASTLLRVIATRAPIGRQDRDVIDPARFEELGRSCFTQLIELRHRGAFSAVAQTFAAFCRRTYFVGDDALKALPEKWYQETLSSIQAQAHAITRRSGGIPALMAGIVAAEPQSSGKLFPQAMRDLTNEATVEAKSSNIEESRLPQVHALNCIKEFFMTSKLGASSEAFIGDGLELAAKMINSTIWPIRNCGLMLFKALIERLLGSDEAQDWKEREMTKTSRFSYHSYPSLVRIIENLLNPEGPIKESLDIPGSNSPMDLHGAEGVFPALQILRQAMPPEEHRMTILQSITKLLSSPHWHMRDMAARTITALYRPSELLTGVKWLLDNFEESSNAKHGKLLCIKYCVTRGLQSSDQVQEFLKESMLHLSICAPAWHTQTSCPYVKGAFLDLVSVCGMFIVEHGTNESAMNVWTALTSAVGVGPDQTFNMSVVRADALLQKSTAEVYFIDRSIIRPDQISVYLSKDFQGIGNALQLLATKNPDTCIAGIDALHEIIKLKTLRGPILQLPLILHDIYRLTLSAIDPEVLSRAQDVLADGLSQLDMPQEVLDLIREPDLLSTLDKLEEQCLSNAPSNSQSALHLLGFFLDWTYKNCPSQRESLWPRIARYICILRMTMVDTNPFDARFAAANSICALDSIWRISSSTTPTRPLLLGLSLVLYDMLNDDDDEIRDAAARATTALLNAHSPPNTRIAPSVPILTSHRLATFLTTHFSTSQDLCREALRRLTAAPLRALLFNVPFAETLAQERKEDTTLFAQEKQNLFFDPTLDALFWSRVLSRCSAGAALATRLGAWVVQALMLLIETSEKEGDGALGWTSKTEVSTLGMRVLCAAEVALRWDVPNAIEIRELLNRFVVVGEAKEVNGLWVGRAEKATATGVVELLRSAGARVRAVEKGLEKLQVEKEEKTSTSEAKTADKAAADEDRVLSFLKGLGARVRATEGGLMKKAGM
ncbi:HEAT repeat protein-like protein [Paraphaeosphaeria sporulosa]|uniref:HEAT repeat protein-like protein n=1 Tax=Paraphaeosphaeria sporulosa TaxID=1460663 RepID=A0A177BX12_9PLEO|nr:HEAT repeat protein-like protein [Paraphaeosphaeria sporulosa]OAF99231.1 HEAT repeat protein-like protein [Paraphaeosphaeria sporulosa]